MQGCILKLSLYSVNTVLILYRTGNMQSAILLLFEASSSLLPQVLRSIHLLMPCYISPNVVYNTCDDDGTELVCALWGVCCYSFSHRFGTVCIVPVPGIMHPVRVRCTKNHATGTLRMVLIPSTV